MTRNQRLATNEIHLYICCKATEQVLKSPGFKPWDIYV